ncbi:hypothetical protein, partial [Thalassolituus sp. UBA3500]|uniref:hypothetical protein n=1 Tax=Thalassolituus sp. UBA3500 TaxID=1947664 RepID=UPI00263B6BB0
MIPEAQENYLWERFSLFHVGMNQPKAIRDQAYNSVGRELLPDNLRGYARKTDKAMNPVGGKLLPDSLPGYARKTDKAMNPVGGKLLPDNLPGYSRKTDKAMNPVGGKLLPDCVAIREPRRKPLT